MTSPYQHGARTTRADMLAVSDPGRSGGAEGNERLTVMTGAVLLILLAVEGFTILRLSSLLTLHFFLGMLLLGPVMLKAGSVTYRFFRYYSGNAPYRHQGPPHPLLRVLGPFIMLLTVGVFGSGVILGLAGPSARQPWLLIHKATFILWFAAMAIHVLAYVPRLPRLLSAEARGAIGGRGVRLSLLTASLAAGLVIAVLTYHDAAIWQTSGVLIHHHHHHPSG